MMNLKELLVYGMFKINSNNLSINFKNETVTYSSNKNNYKIYANSRSYIFTFNTDHVSDRIICNELLEVETGKTCKIYCTEKEILSYIPYLIQHYLIYLKDNMQYETISNLIHDILHTNLFDLDFKISVK